MSTLQDFYENDASRFWDPAAGPVGRDSIVYPLMAGLRGTLLEYGCGAGSLLTVLGREERFSRVIGADISARLLQRLEQRVREAVPQLSEKLQLHTPVDDRLPFLADGSVDVVISVATIEHVIDPYRVLDELHRVARPGATLICSVPNYAYLKHRVALLMGDLPKTGTDEPVERWRTAGWDGMHLHCFTRGSFDILLRDTGWQPCRWTGWGERFGWLGPLRQRLPQLLSGEIIAQCTRLD